MVVPLIARSVSVVGLLICITAPFTVAQGQPNLVRPQRQVIGEVAHISIRLPDWRLLTASEDEVWQRSFVREDTEFLVVHLVIQKKGNAPWRLDILGEEDKVVTQIKAEDIDPSDLPLELWTETIPGQKGTLTLSGDPSFLEFEVDKYIYSVAAPVLRNIVGDNDIEDITNYVGDRIYQWGQNVALLAIIEGDKQYQCTGFLIDDDLVMTNDHCLRSETTGEISAEKITASFNYETANLGDNGEIECEIEEYDYNFDFAILRMRRTSFEGHKGLAVATEDGEMVGADDPLIVIQHPGGKRKKISRSNCLAKDALLPTFAHTCDTEGGSSGSPVLRWSDGLVVGVHTYGFGERGEGELNEAVHMKLVVDVLAEENRELWEEILGK